MSTKRKPGTPRIRLDVDVHPELLKELRRQAKQNGKCLGPYLDESLGKLFHVEAILRNIKPTY